MRGKNSISARLSLSPPQRGEGIWRIDPLTGASERMRPLYRDELRSPRDNRTVIIEIGPVTPNALFWAFVSITNNETQHVTTITPN